MDDEVLLRYETDRGERFLLKTPDQNPVYRFDPSTFELKRADDDSWGRAAGQVYDASSLRSDRSGTDVQRLKNMKTDRKLRSTTGGDTVVAVSVAPSLDLAVVLSKTGPNVYQELFRLPGRTPVGPAMLLPWLRWPPFIAWTPDARFLLFSDGTHRVGVVDVARAQARYPASTPADSPESPRDSGEESLDSDAPCDPANPKQNRCPDRQGRCFKCRDSGDGYYLVGLEPALPLSEAVERYKAERGLDDKDCGDLSLTGSERVRVNDCFANAFSDCTSAELRASRQGEDTRPPLVMLVEPRDESCVIVYFFEHEDADTSQRGLLRNECVRLDVENVPTDCRLVEATSN